MLKEQRKPLNTKLTILKDINCLVIFLYGVKIKRQR